jgi:hypothetical protein
MIADAITRLATLCPTLAGVGDEISLTRHLAKPPASPFAWVHVIGESADPGRLASGRHSQRKQTTFGVLIYLGTDPTTTNGSAAASLESILAEIRAALLGWQPTADHAPVDFVSGDLADLSSGVLFWSETYSTNSYLG